MSIESVMLPNNLILCHPLLLRPSIFSSIRVFTSESPLHIRWPKYWSFSFSMSLSNEYSGFPLGLTDLISLLSKGPSRVFSNTTIWKHQFFSAQPSLWSNSHIHIWLLEKHCFNYRDLCCKVMYLLFNVLSRFVMGFPGGSGGKESTCSVGNQGLILVLGRFPGKVHGNPLQYSCLENPQGQGSLAGYNP